MAKIDRLTQLIGTNNTLAGQKKISWITYFFYEV